MPSLGKGTGWIGHKKRKRQIMNRDKPHVALHRHGRFLRGEAADGFAGKRALRLFDIGKQLLEPSAEKWILDPPIGMRDPPEDDAGKIVGNIAQTPLVFAGDVLGSSSVGDVEIDTYHSQGPPFRIPYHAPPAFDPSQTGLWMENTKLDPQIICVLEEGPGLTVRPLAVVGMDPLQPFRVDSIARSRRIDSVEPEHLRCPNYAA